MLFDKSISSVVVLVLAIVSRIGATTTATISAGHGSITARHIPQVPVAAVISSYKSLFSDVGHWKPQRPLINCCHSGCCNSCCNGVPAILKTIPTPASALVAATATTSPATTFPISGVTTVNEPPLYTTIVPGTSGQSAGSKLKSKLQDILPGSKDNDVENETEQFYALPLSGEHPAVIPLILADESTTDLTPITILSFADLSVTDNYISNTLLTHLGYKATPATTQSPAAALGEIVGEISLSVLTGTGTETKRFPHAVFRVFEPAKSEWMPEVVLGLDFLRSASALRLTDDFGGDVSRLGVVLHRVQKVDVTNNHNHVEL